MEQQYRLLKGSMVYLIIYACAMVGLLIYIGKNATISVKELSQEEISAGAGMDGCITQSFEGQMLIVQKGSDRDYFVIPLDGSLISTDITAENLYLDQQIRVVLKRADSDFYDSFTVTGDQSQVKSAYYHHEGSALHLQFDLDDVYEMSTQYERNALTITLEKPYQKYEKIVVIDPASQRTVHEDAAKTEAFTEDEMQMTWDIACRIRDLLDTENIKVYFSRTEQTESDCVKAAHLAEAVRADMLIRVEPGLSSDKDMLGTKVLYNARFFTPKLNNAWLADLLEREVATSIQGKVLGVEDGGIHNQLLAESMVPTAIVLPGYVSNELEAALLAQEQYREKIADGICRAVKALYEREENAVE